jgi:hypothetical protein
MAGVAALVVAGVHLAYLLYVLFGGFLGLRSVHWLWPHLVTVVWGVQGLVTQVRCPLTELEKHLILLDGAEPYAGTFIATRVAGVLYPTAWQELVWWATAVVVLASYALVLVRQGTAHGLAPR